MTKEIYVSVMHLRNRCVLFTDDNNNIRGLVTFFITDNPKNVIRDGIWGIPKEKNDGEWIMVDRCITDREASIRPNLIELIKYFKQRFPDKKVVWQSRGKKNAEIFAESFIK